MAPGDRPWSLVDFSCKRWCWESGGWRTSFSRYWHLMFMPQKLIFHNMTSVSKLYMAYRSPGGACMFPHSYAAPFSKKVVLCETNNIFCSKEYWVWYKVNAIFRKYIKNKVKVTLDSFRNFVYVSSYLRLKRFSWKRDYVISQKVQMPQTLSRPF